MLGFGFCYNRNGIPYLSWCEWMYDYDCNRNLRRVAETSYGPWWISTVWLGLDMGVGSFWGGPPLIYETAVFKGDSWTDIYMDRYSTLAEAFRGHDRIAEAVISSVEAEGRMFPLKAITASQALRPRVHQSSSRS